jgi:hypothetical protein
MSGPGDEQAAGLRASHADRERVIDLLKAAFVQGRLSKDELDGRVGQVLTSRTHRDLAAVTVDIPEGMAVGRRETVNRVKVVAWGASATSTLIVLLAAAAALAGNIGLLIAFMFALIAPTAVAWGAMVEARLQNRGAER